ncbi:MAG: aldo/keto reductase [Alphaproteobacteria bacterium]|nr:aldo/keto reductase [Alphaproteobacteria bacterium]
MRTVRLPTGERVPALGQGTWMMGEVPARRGEETRALRLGLDLGLTLVDTAEMYGEGATETLVGEAIAGRRDAVFLVSKAYPHNATRKGLAKACERSLKRLKTDRLDLYLLHWRGAVPFAETIAGMEALVRAGKIRHFGVSNLDAEETMAFIARPGGFALATNQVLYNLTRRGIEHDLLPLLAERGIPAMAYSPLEQQRLVRAPALGQVASRLGVTPAQVALAWLLRQEGMIVIPKAGVPAHVQENAGALRVVLDAAALAELDAAFPAPKGPTPLAML